MDAIRLITGPDAPAQTGLFEGYETAIRFADEPGREAWIHIIGSSIFAPTVCLERQAPTAP